MCFGYCWVDKKATDPALTVLKTKQIKNKMRNTCVMDFITVQGTKPPFCQDQERPVYRVIFQQGPNRLERASPMKCSGARVPVRGAGWHAEALHRNDNMRLKRFIILDIRDGEEKP